MPYFRVITQGFPSIPRYAGRSLQKAIDNAKACKGSGACVAVRVVSGPRELIINAEIGQSLPAGCSIEFAG